MHAVFHVADAMYQKSGSRNQESNTGWGGEAANLTTGDTEYCI